MVWDVAKSLDKLLAQINALAPGRSKKSDGSIGDTAHQAGKSEHNPEDKPGSEPDEVDARDFTHDPAAGADMGRIAESLRLSRDRRILYVIWQQRMFSSYPSGGYPAWTWRPYRGKYHSHLHVSVNDVDDDNVAPWQLHLAGSTESSGGEFLMALTGKQQDDIAFTIAGAPNGPSHVRDARVEQKLDALLAAAAASAVREQAIQTAFDGLMVAVRAGGGSIDAAPILARIDQVAAAESATVAQLLAQVADMQQMIAERDARLAQAYADKG